LVDFHGWEMPIRYGSIPEEHARVRLAAGLFDLCHMGRLEVTGTDAAAWVQRVITNDYDAMKTGDARYTLITNEEGGIIDDAVVYRLEESVFIVVNASNREAVIAWMESHRGGLDARLTDRSDDLAMIAVQGPRSSGILPAIIDGIDADLEAMKYYSIVGARIRGKQAWIARTGYTGEDGFEVYLDAADGPFFWRRALEAGGDRIAPIGLGARDTLRLEAGMPLYGNDIDLSTDPFEAGLGFAVKLEKAADFIGKRSLAARKAAGPRRKLTGLRVEGRRVARQGMRIGLGPADGSAPAAAEAVGVVTSGAPSPTLGFPIAMGYLDASVAGKDLQRLAVDIRGNLELVSIHPLPFYSRTRKKKHGS
jgi:aminomethyltransferase